VKQKTTLESEYSKLHANYAGFPTANEPVFDTELVSKIICNLKLGKAADINGLTGEHLLHSHPILQVIISRLFKLILSTCGFKRSYIVPLPKLKDTRTKAMTCDDFRGIAITPILCKLFEYCFLDKHQSLLTTGDNQFAFKIGLGCTNAIYT